MTNTINKLLLASLVAKAPGTNGGGHDALVRELESGNTSTQKKAAKQLLNMAIQAKEDGNFKFAVEIFGTVLGKHDNIVGDKKLLAKSYLFYAESISWSGGDAKLALEYYNKALDMVRYIPAWHRAELYAERGMALVRVGDIEAKAGNTDNARTYYNDAVNSLQTALKKLNPADPYDRKQRKQQINFNIGWIFQYKLNNPVAAKEYYEAALKDVEKYGAMPHVNVGKIYLGLGQIYDFTENKQDAAIEYYQKAINTGALDAAEVAEVYTRMGEIYAVRTLKKPPGAERDTELENINNKYFLRAASNPKARIWTARIYTIVSGADKTKLQRAEKFITDNLSSFAKEDIAEARLMRGEVRMRLQMLNPDASSWDFSAAIEDVNYVINNAKDDGLKARAHLLLAKMELARGNISAARDSIEKAIALKDRVDVSIRNEIDLTNKMIQGVAEFQLAESYRYGDNQDHARALEHYKKAIELLKPISGNEDVKVYLAKSYFGLAELLRYGEGVKDHDASLKYYKLAIALTEKSKNPTILAIAALSYIGMGKIYLERGEFDNALQAYNKAESILNSIKSISPSFGQINVLEVEIFSGLAQLHNIDWDGHKRNPSLARRYQNQASEALKRIPKKERPGHISREIKTATISSGYSPIVFETSYIRIDSEQIVDKKKTEQSREGVSVTVKLPVTDNVTIGGKLEHYYRFDSEVTTDYSNRVETAWDTDGNATAWRDEKLNDLPVLETNSIIRYRIDASYYRNMGDWSFWVVPGIEGNDINYTITRYNWENYYYDFYNYVPETEDRTLRSATFDLRAHFDSREFAPGGWGIQPHFEAYGAVNYRSESNGFEALNRDYMEYLESNPDVPDRKTKMDDIEQLLENDPLVSYYVQPGIKLVAPWRLAGGETSMNLKARYGRDPIGDSLYGFWPVSDYMETDKLSGNITLNQELLWNGVQFGIMGIYNHDWPMSEDYEDGFYYGGEASVRFNKYEIMGLVPELFFSYYTSESEDYTSDSTYGGIRLRLPSNE